MMPVITSPLYELWGEIITHSMSRSITKEKSPLGTDITSGYKSRNDSLGDPTNRYEPRREGNMGAQGVWFLTSSPQGVLRLTP